MVKWKIVHQSGSTPSLTTSTGIAALTFVGGNLQIKSNLSLENVDALSALTSVGGDLEVVGNEVLSNVDGFASVASVGGDIDIYDNPTLTECTGGLGELLADMSIDAFIYDNAPGCNSRWEAMGAGISTEDEAAPLVTELAAVYPNPTVGPISLTYTLAEAREVRLTVYDTLGRHVQTLAETARPAGEHEAVWSATGLPAGTYLVRLEVGDKAWTQRVTVVR